MDLAITAEELGMVGEISRISAVKVIERAELMRFVKWKSDLENMLREKYDLSLRDFPEIKNLYDRFRAEISFDDVASEVIGN